jgi:hypothetical protein
MLDAGCWMRREDGRKAEKIKKRGNFLARCFDLMDQEVCTYITCVDTEYVFIANYCFQCQHHITQE